MKDQKIIELDNVCFTYTCHPVLENIKLAIKTGEAVGLLGPNGSGKTTLLKLILGQLKPQTGSVKLFGVDAHRLKERYRIGYVAQRATNFNTGFPATVREVVASGLVARRGLFKLFTKKDYLQVEHALEKVNLADKIDYPVGSLSGGQQQRVFIARALVTEPQILILDEPTVGIDQSAQTIFYRLLRYLNGSEGITLLIVSHELEGLSTLITRQVCLDRKICTCNCHSFSQEVESSPCTKSLSLQYAK